MKALKYFVVLVLFTVLAFKSSSNSDKLKDIIAKYEAERNYEFKWNESVENTIKYYQAESDFAKALKSELEKVSVEGLSESEQISRDLLLFVLQDKIDTHTFKTYLNPITNERAFHLNLSRIANREFKNKEQVLNKTNHDIEFEILNQQVTGVSPQFFEFDIMASGSGTHTTYLDNSAFVIEYNTTAFRQYIVVTCKTNFSSKY